MCHLYRHVTRSMRLGECCSSPIEISLLFFCSWRMLITHVDSSFGCCQLSLLCTQWCGLGFMFHCWCLGEVTWLSVCIRGTISGFVTWSYGASQARQCFDQIMIGATCAFSRSDPSSTREVGSLLHRPNWWPPSWLASLSRTRDVDFLWSCGL